MLLSRCNWQDRLFHLCSRLQLSRNSACVHGSTKTQIQCVCCRLQRQFLWLLAEVEYKSCPPAALLTLTKGFGSTCSCLEKTVSHSIVGSSLPFFLVFSLSSSKFSLSFFPSFFLYCLSSSFIFLCLSSLFCSIISQAPSWGKSA